MLSDSAATDGSDVYVLVFVWVWSKSSSAVVVTTAWPVPTTLSSMFCRELFSRFWNAAVSESAPSLPPVAIAAPPPVDRILPSAPATVTCVGSRPSTLDATRCTIAWTCWLDSGLAADDWTRTDAVVLSWLSAKTSFCGMTRCTVAASTPSIALIVSAISPSSARW
jgi:hypothetical protein